jgi:single-stranded-DNA-specific exonuclease
MDSANTAVDLLLAENYKDVENLAKSLDGHNSKRRTTDLKITGEAIEMIRKDTSLENAKSTVLFKPDWHKGVIGIVASRCVDKYYRPTIILTESNGKATGSARSVEGFDIYQAIKECADLLDQYGGHMYAAGLTMEVDKVPEFRERFENIVAKRINDEQLKRLIDIDSELNLNQIDDEFYEYLSKMAPFGPGNLMPVFVSRNLQTYGTSRVLKNEHLKFYVQQRNEPGENNNFRVMEAIGWGMAENEPLINSGMPFSIAYYIEENTYRGNTTLQLRVKDIIFD